MAKVKAAIYARVSTGDQSVANQERELRAVAKAKGLEVVHVYTDPGISGAKGRDKRPGLDAALKDAVRGRYDILLVWSVDRLGRSLQDLVAALHELHAADVDLFLHQQALDTRTPAGRAMFGMLGVFAEFERAMIVARVKSGLARARAQGKRLGRPTVPAAVEAHIKTLRAKGHGMLAIGRELGVGTSTVQRVLGA